MRAVRAGFLQMLVLMRRDMMLFAACLAPVLAGLWIRLDVPFLEAVLTEWFSKSTVLSPYYTLIDIFFALLSPAMFCFVPAMVSLEEADERTAAYLFVAPLGRRGYLAARFGIPGAAVPFFIRDRAQYLMSPLPSFWIGKAVFENMPFYILPAFALSAVWICSLLRQYLRKT